MDETALCSVLLPAGDPPEWIQLMTPGALAANDGRKWTLADPAAVALASQPAGVDLVIDYEHQTEFTAKNGQKAIAGGWIKELQARADGIWARVEWTSAAAQHIRAREYRYISPTFAHAKDGTVLRILRAALTNSPALNLTAIASQQSTKGDPSMDQFLKALLLALGLPEDAKPETALAKTKDLVEQNAQASTAIASVRKAFALAENVDVAKAVVNIAAAKKSEAPDPTQFVSIAQFNDVAARLKALQDDSIAEKAEDAVATAMAEGKIAPASKDWAVSYAKKDPEGFAAWAKNTPVIVKPTAIVAAGAPEKKAGALDETELAICRDLGLDPEAFKKTRDQENAR